MSSNMPSGIHQLPILFLLILSTFVAISDQQLVVSRQRIRRRIPQFRPIEPKKDNPFGQNDGNKAAKFMLKCPRTKKNISSLLWSQNDRPMFTVNFLPNGQLEVGNNVGPEWAVEEKVWRSLDNRFELLLTAKRGRFRVEVENGGPAGRQWMVLKIDGDGGLDEDGKMANNLEDEGEWKCQIFVLAPNGKHKLEAESRKRIVGKSQRPQRKIREFVNKNVVAHQSNRHWELWDSLLEGRTFGFAKSDGEFAVFQRTDTSLGAARVGDAIEYTRNEPMEKGGDNLLLGSSGENGWRWRRANSSSLSQKPLLLLNLFLAIFSFILFAHQIQ